MGNKEDKVVESYMFLLNVDESILKLNPILKDDGYEIGVFSIEELERDFYEVFRYDEKKVGNSIRDFRSHLLAMQSWFSILEEGKIFFMKKIGNDIYEESFGIFRESGIYFNNIISVLRYFKIGDITSGCVFHIYKNSRKVILKQRSIYKNSNFISENIYSIKDKDVLNFQEFQKQRFKLNGLTKLADQYYKSIYDIRYYNHELKIINLMIALESIFNVSKEQIGHILSRNASLIIAENKKEFVESYKILKNAYNIRSGIVHGNRDKLRNCNSIVNVLHEYTRKVIISCSKMNMTKKELFDYLNIKGF